MLAEDPVTSMPSPGIVREYRPPGGPGIRVDSHLVDHATVPPFYDSMIAKVMAYAPDRAQAIARMRRALGETVIDGVATNLTTLLEVLRHPDFLDDRHTTSWFDTEFRHDVSRHHDVSRDEEDPR